MFGFHGGAVLKTDRRPSKMPTASITETTTMDTNSRVMKVMTTVHPMHKTQACKTIMDTLVMAIMSSSSNRHLNSSHCQHKRSSSSLHHHSSNPRSSDDHCRDDCFVHFQSAISLEECRVTTAVHFHREESYRLVVMQLHGRG